MWQCLAICQAGIEVSRGPTKSVKDLHRDMEACYGNWCKIVFNIYKDKMPSDYRSHEYLLRATMKSPKPMTGKSLYLKFGSAKTQINNHLNPVFNKYR
jgi:hypothetical protein